MSEEIKKEEVVEKQAPAKRGRTAEGAKKFSEEEVNEMLAQATEQAAQKAVEAYIASHPVTSVVQVTAQKEEMVTLLYMGAVASGSTVHLGDKLGDIMGRGGTRTISKAVFFENMTPNVLNRLKDRRLIVVDGLTDEERERYGVNYSEGELVSKDIYYKLLDLEADTVVAIFKKACFRHKQLIASLYADAYNAHDNRVNQSLIEKLQKASKAVDGDGMFTAILKDMAKSLGDSEDEE